MRLSNVALLPRTPHPLAAVAAVVARFIVVTVAAAAAAGLTGARARKTCGTMLAQEGSRGKRREVYTVSKVW